VGVVVVVPVVRLSAAGHGCKGLDRDAHDVVLRLLRREGRAAGLRVEAESLRLWVRDPEALLHDARPQAACGAELRYLLEEVVVGVEEERETLAELVRRQSRVERCLRVRDAVRE